MTSTAKMRSAGAATGSNAGAKKIAEKKVTAPAYGGIAASSDTSSMSPSPVAGGISVAAQLTSHADSLRFATNEIANTLQRLGLYDPEPAKGEDLAQPAHDNLLRVINEDLHWSMRSAAKVLFQAVLGDSEGEDRDNDSDCGEKETIGSVHKTQYGRSVYGDSQSAIERLLSIQELATRLHLSMLGADSRTEIREAQVTTSVYECVANLISHIDDTVSTLHRVNNDLQSNLLGVNG